MPKPNLQLHPSKILAIFIFLSHAGALIVLIALNLTWWWLQGLAALIVIMSLFISLRQQVFKKRKDAIIAAWCEHEIDWILLRRDNKTIKATLRGDTLMTNFLVILRFNIENKRRPRSVVIFYDALHPTVFRQLKVYLISIKKIMPK